MYIFDSRMRVSFSSAQTKDHEAKECIQGQEKKRKEKQTRTHARTHGNSAGFLKRKENTILNVTTRNRKWNSMSHTKCENGTWKACNTCGRVTTRSASCCCCLKNNPNTEQRVASRERAIGNREKSANRSKKSFKTGVIFRSSNKRERPTERSQKVY